MNVSVFATTNDIDSLNRPFRSRFLEFSLPGYTFEEFDRLSIRLLAQRYRHSPELAHKVASAVWNTMKSKDCRDIAQVGSLSRNISDVDFIVNTLKKYKRKEIERYH